MNAHALHPKYITDEKGKKTEVVLPIDEFRTLIEDLEDLSVIAARKDEELVPFEDVMKEFGINTGV